MELEIILRAEIDIEDGGTVNIYAPKQEGHDLAKATTNPPGASEWTKKTA